MAQYQSSIAVDDVITALGAFLQPFVGTATVVRAEVNRVSMPVDPFVELTEILQVDLETPSVTMDYSVSPPVQIIIAAPKRIDIQIDFYGMAAGDFCTAVKSVFRTSYAAAQFPAGISPLYCTDGHQMPFTTGENQYLIRWTITASLQYNPAIGLPQQSANALAVNILEGLQ